jgi:hypothetical protein
MDNQQLRSQLEQLHAELQQVDVLDDNEREMLRSLEREIRETLERGEEHPQHYSGLDERLRGAVVQLEASHPRTTMLMRQVIDQLAFMGI